MKFGSWTFNADQVTRSPSHQQQGGGAKKIARIKRYEGETRIWVEGGVLLGGGRIPAKAVIGF